MIALFSAFVLFATTVYPWGWWEPLVDHGQGKDFFMEEVWPEHAKGMLQNLVKASAGTALFFPCADGFVAKQFSLQFPGWLTIGLDYRAALLEAANKRRQDALYYRYLHSGSLEGGELYDLIVITVPHNPEPAFWKVIQKLSLCLHPEGRFVIFLPLYEEGEGWEYLIKCKNDPLWQGVDLPHLPQPIDLFSLMNQTPLLFKRRDAFPVYLGEKHAVTELFMRSMHRNGYPFPKKKVELSSPEWVEVYLRFIFTLEKS